MSVLLYDCCTGIAGDINLGALIDLGVPQEHLENELKKLGIENEYEFQVQRATNGGIAGNLVSVVLKNHDQPRDLCMIQELIESSGLTDQVKRSSLSSFQHLAQAEAKVHGVDIRKVHFHEVGATDALIDIVGSAIAMDYLHPEKIYCSPIELGSGTTQSSHGTLPIPAPATAELLVGLTTNFGGVIGEATTPTGAALLKTYVTNPQYPRSFCINKIGYGLGHAQFDRPNVLRVMLGQLSSKVNLDSQTEIECNIDDMPAEVFETLFERLFELGASDVWITPIVMKKSRPANKLSVLCDQEIANTISEEIFRSSTTIGVRLNTVTKRALPRSFKTVETPYGQITVKQSELPDGSIRQKVEHQTIDRLSRLHNVPYLLMKQQLELVLNGTT